MFGMKLLVALLSLSAAMSRVHTGAEAREAAGHNPPEPTVKVVREILLDNPEEEWRARPKLETLGEKAFPAYETILNDQQTSSLQLTRLFMLLADLKGDRARFVEPATRRLTHPAYSVRTTAVRLLGKIGTAKDTTPVVALLFDEDGGVVLTAAETLAAIGEKKDLVAMDIWLRSAAAQKYHADYIKPIREQRDILAKKVAGAKEKQKRP